MNGSVVGLLRACSEAATYANPLPARRSRMLPSSGRDAVVQDELSDLEQPAETAGNFAASGPVPPGTLPTTASCSIHLQHMHHCPARSGNLPCMRHSGGCHLASFGKPCGAIPRSPTPDLVRRMLSGRWCRPPPQLAPPARTVGSAWPSPGVVHRAIALFRLPSGLCRPLN